MSSPLTDDRPRLEVTRLHPEARLPTYATDGSAGLDLCALIDEPQIIQSHIWTPIRTGIAMAIPRGWAGLVRGRSGLAFKRGVVEYDGTIDSDHRGEVRGLLTRSAVAAPTMIEPGERFAQLVLVRAPQAEVVEVDELPPADWSTRTGGFGSTGR